MKLFLILALTILGTLSANAEIVSSSMEKITPSDIERVIPVFKSKDSNRSKEVLNVVVQDLGMSTDLSPRYKIYLGYSNTTELSNIRADFLIDESVLEFISARIKSSTISELKLRVIRNDQIVDVIKTIDSSKIFEDVAKVKQTCVEDFCDQDLKTSVTISETIKRMKPLN